MSSFGGSKKPYSPGIALHRGRGPYLARAESFHPDEQEHLEGPEFHHSPLSPPSDDIFGETVHRTIFTFTSHETLHWLSRSLSCDHARGTRRKDRSPGSYISTFPQHHFEDRAPSAAAAGKIEGSRDNNVSEKSSRLDALCDRCHGINILSLSADGGYVHSTLDVLAKKALTCRLCRVLFRKQGTISGRTLDRYQIVLSLLKHLLDETYSDHPVDGYSDNDLKTVLWMATVDTRPHEFPEGKRGQIYAMGRHEWPPRDPNITYNAVVRGRPILCYAYENDPLRKNGMPWLRDIGTNTASARSLKTAKGWLEKCLKAENHNVSGSAYSHGVRAVNTRPGKQVPWFHHNARMPHPSQKDLPQPAQKDLPQLAKEDLPQKFSTEGPTRLLFITDIKNIEHSNVHLVETHGALFPYATLSYCWGKLGTEWLCTKHNLNQYFHCIDRESLPATIRDCIVIAANLCISYIWIDALCIIQDSSSDWATESAKMGGIYHGSLVTIAAAGSSDSGGGCFNKISRPRFSEDALNPDSRLQRTIRRNDLPAPGSFRPTTSAVCVESIMQNGAKSRLYIDSSVGRDPSDDLFDEEVLQSPLSKRAWVLQEQVLSRRIIYFAQSQLFWECEHCRLSEDNWQQRQTDDTYEIMAYTQPFSREVVIGKWYLGIVESYSARVLTQKTDKLIAISAVARAIYSNRHVDYLAGLWKDCILEGLMWSRSSSGRKSRTYPCPSWSWASQESSVKYSCARTFLDGRSKFIDAHVEREPGAPFGNVKNGWIKLNTRVTTGRVMRRAWRYRYHKLEQDLIFSDTSGTIIWDATVIMDDDDDVGHEVTIAYIGGGEENLVALLLEPVLGTSQTYRRVGLLTSGKLANRRQMVRLFRKSVSWTQKTIIVQ
jgi:hypothetical protein